MGRVPQTSQVSHFPSSNRSAMLFPARVGAHQGHVHGEQAPLHMRRALGRTRISNSPHRSLAAVLVVLREVE